MSDRSIFYDNCFVGGNLDWCEYACIDATNGNTWYHDFMREEACNAVASAGDEEVDAERKRMMEQKMAEMRAHEVSLASKSVAVENDSYNAGYYLAGASILGAAAVAFITLKKKGEKVAYEEPLLASDDAIKATM